MNKEEILAMEAGRELDAYVGLKLGLVTPIVAGGYMSNAADLDESHEKYKTKNLLPKYSTDICAAWEVIEKMDGAMEFVRRHKDVWYCRLNFNPDWIEGNTVQEAICKCALLAVMDS